MHRRMDRGTFRGGAEQRTWSANVFTAFLDQEPIMLTCFLRDQVREREQKRGRESQFDSGFKELYVFKLIIRSTSMFPNPDSRAHGLTDG